MECPACGSEIKEVPAGVSKKTGKPYNAFQVCSNKTCGWKPAQKEGFTSRLVENHNPKAPQNPPHTNNSAEKSMLLSYAKDIVVAQINSGVCPPEPSKQVLAYFTDFLQAFKQ